MADADGIGLRTPEMRLQTAAIAQTILKDFYKSDEYMVQSFDLGILFSSLT
jgi:hypothetical protein